MPSAEEVDPPLPAEMNHQEDGDGNAASDSNAKANDVNNDDNCGGQPVPAGPNNNMMFQLFAGGMNLQEGRGGGIGSVGNMEMGMMGGEGGMMMPQAYGFHPQMHMQTANNMMATQQNQLQYAQFLHMMQQQGNNLMGYFPIQGGNMHNMMMYSQGVGGASANNQTGMWQQTIKSQNGMGNGGSAATFGGNGDVASSGSSPKPQMAAAASAGVGNNMGYSNNNINANAVPVPSNAMGGGIVDDPGWEDNFHSLIRYKMEHGHCKVCILCLLAVYAHILCSSSTILLFYCFTGSSSIQGGSKVGTLGNDTA